MKRLLILATVSLLLAGLIAWSTGQTPVRPTLQIEVSDRNPWTHLRINRSAEEFQFAIVSDRTGGHRAKIFSRAVEYLNLLQPAFVVSVGDLIEGYTEKLEQLEAEWREFDSFVGRLQMPFFYVPGNHDYSNAVMERLWKAKFSKPYYHFIFQNVLFLMVNSDDPPKTSEGHISREQVEYFRRVLEANRQVRWTLVFLHRPLWASPKVADTGWLDFEQMLEDRPYTVFAGHIHKYKRFVRKGRLYYQLATTGGASKLRGVEYGEFDHIVWVTMKRTGPVICNLLLDGIYPENLQVPDTDEPGQKRKTLPTTPVEGKVTLRGEPVPGALVVFVPVEPSSNPRADSLVDVRGQYRLSTYVAWDGAAPGKYKVVITLRREREDATFVNLLPEKYASAKTTPFEVTVEPGKKNVFDFDLE
ncbi:MAG: metallophosphoesterase [Gemmatales bacterium]|nr:metallophosphoesterase [Gemmatales bacterium]MDW7994132.1 metallophosphoesterase [Gemmatales bacterium]